MVVNAFVEGIPALYWMKYILIITSILVNSLLCTRYDRDCYNKTFKKMPQKYVTRNNNTTRVQIIQKALEAMSTGHKTSTMLLP